MLPILKGSPKIGEALLQKNVDIIEASKLVLLHNGYEIGGECNLQLTVVVPIISSFLQISTVPPGNLLAFPLSSLFIEIALLEELIPGLPLTGNLFRIKSLLIPILAKLFDGYFCLCVTLVLFSEIGFFSFIFDPLIEGLGIHALVKDHINRILRLQAIVQQGIILSF